MFWNKVGLQLAGSRLWAGPDFRHSH